ncbi:hypothetical protein [Mucilaginibacter sp.]|uniref:hypothetical protein n=1 Tax=Mucilaginibacter sp. TaxID=1882438 RepID=UPI002850B665|nr:hypothetical protein [Mucilaginibacter sp.]MDR3694286.1 hypothetical protein [Mucilaginibacter sp.]
MTVTININSAEQEKLLFDFLERMNFDYESDQDRIALTESQKEEILRRDNDFINGKTTARNWDEIKKDLERVYR